MNGCFPPFATSGQASLPQGERLWSHPITLIRDEPFYLRCRNFAVLDFFIDFGIINIMFISRIEMF